MQAVLGRQGNQDQTAKDEARAQQAAGPKTLLQNKYAHQYPDDYPHLPGRRHIADSG